MKYCDTVPKEAGAVVAMVVFDNQVIVACQYRVFRIINDKLFPMRFVDDTGNKN